MFCLELEVFMVHNLIRRRISAISLAMEFLHRRYMQIMNQVRSACATGVQKAQKAHTKGSQQATGELMFPNKKPSRQQALVSGLGCEKEFSRTNIHFPSLLFGCFLLEK